MKGINVGRWFAGGLVAGLLIWLVEGAASMATYPMMQEAMQAHGLSMAMNATAAVVSLLASLLAGLMLVFFYAAVRPRFGPGPKTAVTVAVVLWAGGYVVSVLGYLMLGLFPHGLLLHWGLVGLVEMILAGLVGGWIYREPEAV
jgi:hypothetical protein